MPLHKYLLNNGLLISYAAELSSLHTGLSLNRATR